MTAQIASASGCSVLGVASIDPKRSPSLFTQPASGHPFKCCCLVCGVHGQPRLRCILICADTTSNDPVYSLRSLPETGAGLLPQVRWVSIFHARFIMRRNSRSSTRVHMAQAVITGALRGRRPRYSIGYIRWTEDVISKRWSRLMATGGQTPDHP